MPARIQSETHVSKHVVLYWVLTTSFLPVPDHTHQEARTQYFSHITHNIFPSYLFLFSFTFSHTFLDTHILLIMSLSSPNMPKEKAIDHPVAAVVPPKKRRKPSADVVVNVVTTEDKNNAILEVDELEEDDDDTEEEQQQQQRAKRHHKDKQGYDKHHSTIQSTPPFQPAMMALPPPLLSYPHHQVAYYHPLYPVGPFYLPVGSSPPLTPHRPSSTPRSRNSTGASGTTRILPKVSPSDGNSAAVAATSSSATSATCFASPPLHPNSPGEYIYHHHPFSIPIAPASGDPITAAAASARRDSSSTTLTTADQREQARKMSHSAIERRRRERINDKIVQLRQLIPSCANQEHLHKMTVLQSAIDYIAYLKDVVARLDGEESLNVNLKNNKAPKSMMPREVEAFTTQFSVTKNDARLQHQRRSSTNSSDANKQSVSSNNEPSEQHSCE